jgi:molybdate transport system ATP-binding protein
MPSEDGRYVGVALSHLDLHRDGRAVLRDIDWRIRPGERWVVCGENGAGKTQLLKIVAGMVWPDPARRVTRRYSWRGEIFETPHGVLDEIAYVGPERQDRHERHDFDHTVLEVVGTGFTRSDIPQGPMTPLARRRARTLLARVGVDRLARRDFLTLSFGERRLVLLARALASAPRLLLLDELFTGVDAVNRARLLRWFERTRRSRLPWVLTTHRLDEAPASATHRLDLAAGRVVRRSRLRARKRRAAESAAQPSRPAAERQVALRPNSARQRSSGTPAAAAAGVRRAGSGTPLVELEHVAVFLDWRPVLHDITFAVRAGECWVVHGPNGSGKSTLLRTIYGDHPAALGGRLRRRGIVPGVPLEQFRRWCGVVAPHLQTLYPRDSLVLDVVVSGLHSSIGLNRRASAHERARAQRALELFAAGAFATRRLGSLSYGQVRRVLFARAWIRQPRLLLLDEPFAGLDARTRSDLRAAVSSLRERGVAIVMATHHRDEWPAGATHEIELVAGRIVHAGPIRTAVAGTGRRSPARPSPRRPLAAALAGGYSRVVLGGRGRR